MEVGLVLATFRCNGSRIRVEKTLTRSLLTGAIPCGGGGGPDRRKICSCSKKSVVCVCVSVCLSVCLCMRGDIRGWVSVCLSANPAVGLFFGTAQSLLDPLERFYSHRAAPHTSPNKRLFVFPRERSLGEL